MDSKELYYSHREVSEALQKGQSTVCHWAKTFAVQVHHDSTGRLKYSQDNLRGLQLIRYLLRESSLTIDGAKATLRYNPREAEQRAKAIIQLKAVRDESVELRQLIEQIEHYTSTSEVRDRLRQKELP